MRENETSGDRGDWPRERHALHNLASPNPGLARLAALRLPAPTYSPLTPQTYFSTSIKHAGLKVRQNVSTPGSHGKFNSVQLSRITMSMSEVMNAIYLFAEAKDSTIWLHKRSINYTNPYMRIDRSVDYSIPITQHASKNSSYIQLQYFRRISGNRIDN